jgi:hypothetical protein
MSMTESASSLPGVGNPLRLAPVTNLERMYALDEAWNARDWETFDAYHEQSDVVVYWPGREATPTQGGRDHRAESIRFCAAFPDNKVKHPYDILFWRWRVHGFHHTDDRELHMAARATRRDGHRTDRRVVRSRVLNDRPLAGAARS